MRFQKIKTSKNNIIIVIEGVGSRSSAEVMANILKTYQFKRFYLTCILRNDVISFQ